MNKHETALYCKVWIKAAQKGELKLTFGDHRECYRARFGLYSVRTQARKGELHDPELIEALKKCSIYLDKKDWSLTISSKIQGSLNAKIAEAIGFDEEEELSLPVTGFEGASEVAESARKLMEKLNEPAQPRTTPYYTRGDE